MVLLDGGSFLLDEWIPAPVILRHQPGWIDGFLLQSSPQRRLRQCAFPLRVLSVVSRLVRVLTETRRFRDVLKAKGCSVQYREYNGDHDVLEWRGPFVEGLTALTLEK